MEKEGWEKYKTWMEAGSLQCGWQQCIDKYDDDV
jgi:hypothetical protein